MRIPKDIQELVKNWTGTWHAVRMCDGNTGVDVKTYSNGEELQSYEAGPGRAYQLWSYHRNQRVETFRTAREMWDHLRNRLQQGPDCFGLVESYRDLYRDLEG